MDQVQARGALVGAWRLISWENRAANGQVTYPMGPDALGYLLYPADGRFSVTISRPGRAGFAAADLLSGTTESRPGPWRALSPTPAATPSTATASSTTSSCHCSSTGRERSAEVGRARQEPTDPERQPAAAGRQAAGPPPGLGAGRPLARHRLTPTWQVRRITTNYNAARTVESVPGPAPLTRR